MGFIVVIAIFVGLLAIYFWSIGNDGIALLLGAGLLLGRIVFHFARNQSEGRKLLAIEPKLNIDKKAFGTKRSAMLWHRQKEGRFEVRMGDKNSTLYDDTKLVFFSYSEEEARDFYDRFLLSPAAMLASPQEPKHDKPLEKPE